MIHRCEPVSLSLHSWCKAMVTCWFTVSLGYPWKILLVWSLMGQLWVGLHGLQPLRFGFKWVDPFAVCLMKLNPSLDTGPLA